MLLKYMFGIRVGLCILEFVMALDQLTKTFSIAMHTKNGLI
jgi:hypothetical protein